MNYERLTKIDGELIYSNCKSCKYYRRGNERMCDEWICYTEQKKRLAELEDKIENKTLVEFPRIIQREDIFGEVKFFVEIYKDTVGTIRYGVFDTEFYIFM